MTFPKHQNPSKGNEATAPYNFVPLPDKVETVSIESLPDHDSYDVKRHTGRIEVKLTTASPLYIRGGLSPEDFAEFGKKSFYELSPEQQRQVAQFFHTHDENNPVIPGSSLRGMLRAMIEIITYGKVQPVSDKQLVYRAVGKQNNFTIGYRKRLMQEDGEKNFTPLLQAGYIEKRGLDWFIRPAQEINGVTFSRILINNVPSNLPQWHNIKNAHKIWFKPGPYGYKNVKEGFIKMKFSDALEPSAVQRDGLQLGTHITSGEMHGKKFDRIIYSPNQTVSAISIPNEMVASYQEQISKEQVVLLGQNGVLQDKHPVFYLMENDKLIFFGHTMMLRLPYLQTPQDFVPKMLRRELDIGFAEAMFGYVKNIKTKNLKEKAYAGRIFVEDARLAQPVTRNKPIVPKILGSPKPTSFQHYLTQPNLEMQFSHYDSKTPEETVIRGHKLYWHRGENPDILHPKLQDAPEKQITKIKPLESDVSFKFTLHFENFSKLELGALWWVLRLGADPNYRLKLGMGKPLGMGAVKTEPTLKLTRRNARYKTFFSGNQWQTGTNGDSDNTLANKRANDFEKFIRKYHKDAFGGEGRIAQLYALLHFPGPNPSDTEYMGLSEFRERHVLPTPLAVHPYHHKKTSESEYKKFQSVTNTWQVVWNNKKNRSETKMPNGETAVINLKRKPAQKLDGQTVELVVAKIENGVCYLEEY